MTDTIEQKALKLVNEVMAEYPLAGYEMAAKMALCRAIEQHEAFRQEVSDAVERWSIEYLLGDNLREDMARFIIAKPDPLVAAVTDVWPASCDEHVNELRAAIEKRGGKLTWGEG